MSNRDKYLITLVAIAAVILLPYFLYIKPKRDETVNVKNEVVELQARYDYLNELNANRDFYIAETEKYNEMRDEIIALFPADIRKENYTMFLLNTEYSQSYVDYYLTPDEEEEDVVRPEPINVVPLIRIQDVTYGGISDTPISSEDTDTGFVARSNSSAITYSCYDFETFVDFLQYLMDYEDPMVFRNISIEFDGLDGSISGSMTLAQYAVQGGDRELEAVVIDPDLDENDLRGNEHYGIFGPYQMQLDAEREALEEGEGENNMNFDDNDDGDDAEDNGEED